MDKERFHNSLRRWLLAHGAKQGSFRIETPSVPPGLVSVAWKGPDGRQHAVRWDFDGEYDASLLEILERMIEEEAAPPSTPCSCANCSFSTTEQGHLSCSLQGRKVDAGHLCPGWKERPSA